MAIYSQMYFRFVPEEGVLEIIRVYALFVFFVVLACVLSNQKHIIAFSAQVMQAGVCGIWKYHSHTYGK